MALSEASAWTYLLRLVKRNNQLERDLEECEDAKEVAERTAFKAAKMALIVPAGIHVVRYLVGTGSMGARITHHYTAHWTFDDAYASMLQWTLDAEDYHWGDIINIPIAPLFPGDRQ
jgi:hypothetical protein